MNEILDEIGKNDIPFLVEAASEEPEAVASEPDGEDVHADAEETPKPRRKRRKNPDETGENGIKSATEGEQSRPRRKKKKKRRAKSGRDEIIEDFSLEDTRFSAVIVAIITAWRQFFGGQWFRRNVFFLLFLTACVCTYIYARYQYQELRKENIRLQNQLNDCSKRAVLSAAALTEFTRRSHIEALKTDSTLTASEAPPIVIEVDEESLR